MIVFYVLIHTPEAATLLRQKAALALSIGAKINDLGRLEVEPLCTLFQNTCVFRSPPRKFVLR